LSQPFLIVGLQRSGTTYAASVVGGHPQTSTLGPELRQPFFERGAKTFVGDDATFADVKRTFPALFDAMTLHPEAGDAVAHGAKCAVSSHQEAVALCDCLDTFLPATKVILVTRRDLIASYGSLVRATRSGVWHSWSKQESQRQLRLPPRAFRRYVTMSRATTTRFRTLSERHDLLELCYEEHICTGQAPAKLFEFLGLEPAEPTWVTLQKLNPPADSYVRNHAKLQRLLDTMPEVSTAQEAAMAAEARRLHANQLSPTYLLGRALEHALQRRIADALRDIEHAVPKQIPSGSPHLCARLCAVLDAYGDDAAPARSASEQIAAAFVGNQTFAEERAKERARIARAPQRLVPR